MRPSAPNNIRIKQQEVWSDITPRQIQTTRNDESTGIQFYEPEDFSVQPPTTTNSAERRKQMFSEDHPGSLSFGIFNSPDSSTTKNAEEIRSQTESWFQTDVINNDQSKAEENSRATLNTDNENIRWGSVHSSTQKPVLSEETVEEREEQQRIKIKPKRWNSDFEHFKQQSGLEEEISQSKKYSMNYDRLGQANQRSEMKEEENKEPSLPTVRFNRKPIGVRRKEMRDRELPREKTEENKFNDFKDIDNNLNKETPNLGDKHTPNPDYFNRNSDERNFDRELFNKHRKDALDLQTSTTAPNYDNQDRRKTKVMMRRPNSEIRSKITGKSMESIAGDMIDEFPEIDLDKGLNVDAKLDDMAMEEEPKMFDGNQYTRDSDDQSFMREQLPPHINYDDQDRRRTKIVSKRPNFDIQTPFIKAMENIKINLFNDPTTAPQFESISPNEKPEFDEKSKEGLGFFGPFFDLDFSSEDDVVPSENIVEKVKTEEQTSTSSSMPSIFLPTVNPEPFSSKEPKVEFNDFISSIPEFEDDASLTIIPMGEDLPKPVMETDPEVSATISYNYKELSSEESGIMKESTRVSTSLPSEDAMPLDVVFSTSELPQAEDISNILEENEYSKTHIRLQKTKAREMVKTLETIVKPTVPSTATSISDVQEENRYSLTHISKLKTKKNSGAPRDYSKVQVKDILKKMPVSKLTPLLRSGGFQVSDLFKKVPEALDLVFKAMGDDSLLEEQLSDNGKDGEENEERKMAESESQKEESLEADETDSENKLKMPWPSRPKMERKSNSRSYQLSREEDNANEVNNTEKKDDEDLRKEAQSMDVKSLMKKISPMSLSEVLQIVGFSLPDVMGGDKNAIYAVLKYHKNKNSPKLETKSETEPEDDSEPEYKNERKWRPNSSKENAEISSSTEVTTTTTESSYPKRKTSAIDLFAKFKKKFRTVTTTAKSTTLAQNMVTSANRRFGERTTRRRYSSESAPEKEDKILDEKILDLEKLSENTEEKVDEEKTSFDKNEFKDYYYEDSNVEKQDENEEMVTSPNDDMMNYTLSNLNMTVDDFKERKDDLTVPDLSQIFDTITRKSDSEPDIIYGAKTPEKDKDKEVQKKERPKYIQMDFGKGGYRGGYSNPFNTGLSGNWGSGSSGIVTNRRTSTTTRSPITYFDINGDLVEDNLDINSLSENSLLGDYEVMDYLDQYIDESVEDVPEGIKSALIASSVVGGLAVILFLTIFMLCLWKQMKSKLRMSGDYPEEKRGVLSWLFCARKETEEKEQSGYFNKVSTSVEHSEPNYSTTSSEEY